jgi:hypothetical protein
VQSSLKINAELYVSFQNLDRGLELYLRGNLQRAPTHRDKSAVKKKTIGILATSVVLSALCIETMLEQADFTNSRRKAPLPQLICGLALLLSAFSTAIAEPVPLPRARPSGIPGDQSLTSTTRQVSQCQQRLAQLAEFKALPAITGPGECTADDVVAIDSVVSPDNHHITLSPSATLRCPMAEAVALWLRDDVVPVIATRGTSLRAIETADSFACRGRNGSTGGKLSEHGYANALDVRALKLTDGRTIVLTDPSVSKSLRENLRQRACARFTTVLGDGADAYHDSHVHLDLLQRSNNYRICQWDVLDVAESAALAAKKAMASANAATVVARDVPLPRPRPVLKSDMSTLSQHRHEHPREARRGSIFDMITPLMKYAR